MLRYCCLPSDWGTLAACHSHLSISEIMTLYTELFAKFSVFSIYILIVLFVSGFNVLNSFYILCLILVCCLLDFEMAITVLATLKKID